MYRTSISNNSHNDDYFTNTALVLPWVVNQHGQDLIGSSTLRITKIRYQNRIAEHNSSFFKYLFFYVCGRFICIIRLAEINL